MRVLVLAILIAWWDQATKHRVLTSFYLEESVPVLPGFFELTYVRNTGAAWGMLDGFNLGLAALSLVVLAMVVLFRRHFMGPSWAQHVAVGLMAGGIVGNLYDRVRLGFVVDFLHFYRGSWSFPAFNVADAAICTGVFLYLVTSWRAEPKPA